MKIKEIVKDLNKKYFLPDIQRNYVWLKNPKEKKIEKLFDSIIRGYPIGSFCFWKFKKSDIADKFNTYTEENEKKIPLQLIKFIENYDVRKPYNDPYLLSQFVTDEDKDLSIVIDGQQRLTSLYLGLCGSRCLKNRKKYEITYLYLDLLYKPSDDNPEDRYMFEFITSEKAIEDNKNESKCWFKVSEVMDFENRQDIQEYSKNHKYTDEERYIIEDLWNAVNDDKLYCYEETQKSVERMLQIFVRVNSGGQSLSYSDLLMSILTASFTSNIREKMNEVVEVMEEKGFSCFGRDQILKTCMILSGCNHVFKMENFNKTNICKIEENWESIIECLYHTADILIAIGYANELSSGYIMTVISMYLFKIFKKNKNNEYNVYNKTKLSSQEQNAMKRFVQITQIRGYFTTSLDTKLSKIKEYIDSTDNFNLFLNQLKIKEGEFEITYNTLKRVVEDIKYGSNVIFPVLQLLYPDLNYGNVIFHIDHIYPKVMFGRKKTIEKGLPKLFKDQKDGLWNLQLLEGGKNQVKAEKDPMEWLKDEYKDNVEAREKYYKDNYIPTKFNLEWSNIEEFKKEREKLILEKLTQIFDVKIPNETDTSSNLEN